MQEPERIQWPLKLGMTSTPEDEMAADKAEATKVSSGVEKAPELDVWLVADEGIVLRGLRARDSGLKS